MFLPKKLSAKIFFGVFIGTILGVAAVGVFSFLFTQAALEKSIGDNQLQLARQTLNKIDHLLYERLIDIQQIAGEKAMEEFFHQLKEGNAAVDPVLEKNLLKRIGELAFVTGPWDVLFAVDTHGKIILSANEKLLGDFVESYPYKAVAWRASIKGDFYYSDLVISKDTGQPSIIFSAPIRKEEDLTEPILGVIVGNFSWPAALEILSEVSTHAVLLDREGRIIGSGRALSHLELMGDKVKSGPAFPSLVGGKSRSIVIPKGKGTLPEKALTSIAVQSGYLSYRGSGWNLVLETPTAQAFAPATQTATRLVCLLIPILLVTSIFFIFMILKVVVDPVSVLNRTIHAITAGDLTQQAPVKSEDEIGELAESFNAMTAKLRESHETLEKKVAERTAELSKANEELNKEIEIRKHVEKVALQSEKLAAMGQLAGGVAHEINNPLGVILGFAEGIVKRLQPGDPFEMPLKSIEREATRCKGFVQNLLTFSRVNKTEKEEMDLNQAIESSLSLVLAQSKFKNAELLKEFAPDLPKIIANNSQIQQIIINLCNNAFDAMPSGGKIIVRTQKSRLNGSEAVEIQVEDTGQGIPPEIQSKIFEPFFTTKDVGKGTGLGLSLVYEIVKKHNGNIDVQSHVGKGTIFRVVLPRS